MLFFEMQVYDYKSFNVFVNVDIPTCFKTIKVSSYLQLKYTTPCALLPNFVYIFTGQNHTALPYVGMTTHLLVTTKLQHLQHTLSKKSAIKNQADSWTFCVQKDYIVNDYKIIKFKILLTQN